MSSEWRECALGKLITLQRGHDLPSGKRMQGRVPIMGSAGITGYHDKSTTPGPGVVIGRSGVGSMGVVSYIDRDYWALNTSLYVTDFHGNDVKFIYYLLSTINFRQFDTGSAQASLNRNIVYPHLVKVPSSVHEQRRIAQVLSALDDRITLLHETNDTLEAIARALFKSWFVDFDPVRTKAEGRSPEGMDAATAALLPDSFEESEIGPIPKGWHVGCVEDICSIITNGGTPSRSNPKFWEDGAIPWFKTGEFHDSFLLKPSEFITEEALQSSSVKLLPKDAVLMAIYAAPTVGRLGILTEPATFNQACTGMVAKDNVGPWFLFWTLYYGRDWFNSRANGAAQQNISKAIVSAYRVVIPSPPVLVAFNDTLAAIHEVIRANSEKVMTLSGLRDTLLPRLISGQVRFNDSHDLVEEVVT